MRKTAIVAMCVTLPLAAQVPHTLSPTLVRTPGTPSQTFYAAANGLFRSTDGGVNWTAAYITEPGRPQPQILSMLIDARNPAVLYVSTTVDAGAVWRSADGGATWTPANTGLPQVAGDATHLTQPPSQEQNLYVKIGNALFKSVDGANTWTRQGTIPGAGRAFVIHPNNPSRMYYAAPAGLTHYSTDEGRTWTAGAVINLFNSTLTSVNTLAVDFANPDRVYAGVAGSFINSGGNIVTGIHLSTNGLQNIQPMHSSQTLHLFTDPAGRPYIYESTSSGGLRRSANRGQTFENVVIPATPLPLVREVHFDRNNPDRVYASAGRGILRSTNAGVDFAVVETMVRPTLAVPATNLEFMLAQGETGSMVAPLNVLEFSSLGIPFTIDKGSASWLDVSVAQGTTPATITVTVNSAGLEVGTYSAGIQVTSPHAANGTIVLPVRMTVARRASGGSQYTISTIAGNGQTGTAPDGVSAVDAPISASALAVDPAGNVFVAGGSVVRRVSPAGILTRVAGTGTSGTSGDGGPATSAQLGSSLRVAVDNQGRLFISDLLNSRVRMVSEGNISLVAGPDTRIGTAAFSLPRAIAVRPDGRIVVTNSRGILLITLPNQVVDAFGIQPSLGTPAGVAVDTAGNYYIADSAGHRIVRVSAQGLVSTIAGNGSRGFTGDAAQATSAALNAPSDVAVDTAGNVIIADTGNHRIRVVTPDGAIRTIAGTGQASFGGDGGPAALAGFSSPSGVAVDTAGNIYFTANSRVRKLTRLLAPMPQLSDNSFVHAADASDRLSAGGLFSLYGLNLGLAEDLASGAPWPTTLSGATVYLNDRPVPLYFNNGTQINGQIPYDTPAGPATVRVDVAGTASRLIQVNIIPAAPGILQYGDQRAAALNIDGSLNTPQAPAAPGSVVVVFLTGIGPLDNPVPTAAAAPGSPLSRAAMAHSATIGDAQAPVLFLGLSPGFVGLAQANLTIPALPPGNYRVVITVNGVASNAAFISVGQ
jgi:uncharacterized protein (TIGR03437 family)